MNSTAAAWVRTHAWTEPVQAEAKRSHPVVNKPCPCQKPFTSAACSGGSCTSCEAMPFFTAETVLIGPGGWVYDLSKPEPQAGGTRAMWVWLNGPPCFTRCGCTCHGRTTKTPAEPAAPPVQLNLFAEAAL